MKWENRKKWLESSNWDKYYTIRPKILLVFVLFKIENLQEKKKS